MTDDIACLPTYLTHRRPMYLISSRKQKNHKNHFLSYLPIFPTQYSRTNEDSIYITPELLFTP